MTQFLLPPGFRATDDDDNPLSGGYYRFYAGGTTTPKAVYSDAALTSSLGTTVNLNSAGEPVTGSNVQTMIYLNTGTYRVRLYDADDTIILDQDGIPGSEEEAAVSTTGLPIIPVDSKTGAYTVVVGDRSSLINCNPTGGSFTVTLPSAVTVGDNFVVGFRHNGTANQVSIVSTSSQTIRGAKNVTSYALINQGDTAWFISDGSDWIIASRAQKAPAIYRVLDSLAAPPVSPAAGAMYRIDGTPTGQWSTLGFADEDLAEADGNGSWIRHTPESGWIVFDVDVEEFLKFTEGQWGPLLVSPEPSTLATAVFEHQLSANTVGGTASAAAWTKRTLNTSVQNDIDGCSLSSSQVTLRPGKYAIDAWQSFYNTRTTLSRLSVISGTATPTLTESAVHHFQVTDGGLAGGIAEMAGTIFHSVIMTVTVEAVIEIQYYVGSSNGTSDLGLPKNNAAVERYALVRIVDLSAQQGPQGDEGDPGADGRDAAYAYQFNTATSGDPGTGKILVNNATPASVTQISVHQTDANSAVLTAVIASWDDSTSTTSKARIRFHKEGAPANFFEFLITGTGTDVGDYWTFPVSYVSHGGAISNGNDIAVLVIQNGDIGDPGTTVPDISGLTEDTANDDESDFLIEYDTSAAGHKKVLPKNIGFTPAGGTRRSLQSKLREWVTPEDFGGYSWAATVLAAAASDCVLLRGGAMTAAVAAADFDDLCEILPKLLIAPGSSLAVTVGAGVVDCEEPILLVGTELDAVTINGATPIAVTISGVNGVSSSVFNVTHWDSVARDLNYHEVEYNVNTVTGVAVGQFLIVETTSTATDHELHRGAWEIIDVDSGNSRITVLHTGHTAPPSASFTGTGAVLPTVIRFLDGTAKGFTALQAEDGAALGEIDDIAFVGTGRPVVDGDRGPSGYDVPGGNSGVTGIIARDNGTLEFGSRFVASGFSGTNAGANRSGSIVTTGYSCNAARNGWLAAVASSVQAQAAVAAGNLIDGFIAQDTSYNFCSSSRAVGNHRHGYISSNNSSLNASSTISKGNRGDGHNCLLSAANVISAEASGNGGSGLSGTNGSNVRGTGYTATDNTGDGISLDGGSSGEFSNCDVHSNSGTDIEATGGSLLSIISHETANSPTYSQTLDVVAADGSLIRSTSARAGVHRFILAASAVASTHTGNTTETTLATVVIPADILQLNGQLHIRSWWSAAANNANVKTTRVKFGGTVFSNPVLTSLRSLSYFTTIMNRNSASSQFGGSPTTVATGLGSSTAVFATGAIDTSSAQNLTFTIELANGSDSVTLEAYEVEVVLPPS